MSRPPRPTSKPAPRVSWLDRFLIGLAPGWGLRRVRARAAAYAYEAAGGGRRTDGWYRRGSDANAAAAPSAAALRELSRDLLRNNGWARRGVQAISNNTVSWGITPKPVGVPAGLAQRAAEVWREWADVPSCDRDGRMPFAGLERLVMDTVTVSGEALVVRQQASESDGLAIPLRIQVLEPDYLDTTKYATDAGARILQGIEVDRRGRRVAYWLYTSHPGSEGMVALESRRVPAEDVLHIYRMERPGQMRGVSWLASAIARLNDFDDFEDAQLMQQKIAACFAAFVQDFDGAGTPLGATDPLTPPPADLLESLEPGHISYLPAGKSVAFATPPTVTDSSFTTRNLRQIAASLGVTYEDLTGDYSQSNFSSSRMARLAHWANVHDWRWNMLVPQLCDGVWRWAMELAAGLEGWPEVPRAEWAAPPMPMLDPAQEGLAYQRLVRSGAMTLYQMIRERGEDPEVFLAELAAGNAKLDELGIILDCDPRQTTTSGQKQGSAAAVGGAPGANGHAPPEDMPAPEDPAQLSS